MDKILLVARREYIAYVTAWGFWLGLIFTPLMLAVSVAVPSLIKQTQPPRYYTVIESGDTFRDALKLELKAESPIAKMDLPVGDADALSPPQSFVFVPPPADSVEGLAPFLLGQTSVDGDLGPRELYGAFVVLDDRIEFWSTDLVSSDLWLAGERVSRALERRKVFEAAGIDEATVAAAVEKARPIETRSPAVSDASGRISAADRAPFFVALALSFMLWLFIFSVVNNLLTGTIEERSNKIFDTLLTSISLGQMLSGKLLGVLWLSLTLIGVWGGVSLTISVFGRSQIPPEMLEGVLSADTAALLFPALLSFIFGYLMYGAMFLALGSLCDTIQEAQALLSPVFIVMMVPLFMIPVAIGSPDSPLLEVLSWVPLLTPFLLILRIPNELPLWEIIAQMTLMAAFTVFAVWLGTQVYRAGAVHGMGVSDLRRLTGQLLNRKPRAQN